MKSKQNSRPLPFRYKLIVGLLLFAGMFVVSITLGAADATFSEVWSALTTQLSGEKITMLREIRIPREVGAILVGAGLAVSGAIMQGITRNPLADPGLLGLTSGANAALAFTFAFLPGTGYFGIMIACFIGAALGTLMAFGLALYEKGGSLRLSSS